MPGIDLSIGVCLTENSNIFIPVSCNHALIIKQIKIYNLHIVRPQGEGNGVLIKNHILLRIIENSLIAMRIDIIKKEVAQLNGNLFRGI